MTPFSPHAPREGRAGSPDSFRLARDPQRAPGRVSRSLGRRRGAVPRAVGAQRQGARPALRPRRRSTIRSRSPCSSSTAPPEPVDLALPRRHVRARTRPSGASSSPFVVRYDAAVFTLGGFVPPDFPVGRTEIIPPAIDPESPKNLQLGARLAARVLEWIGVDTNRPLSPRSRGSTNGRIRSAWSTPTAWCAIGSPTSSSRSSARWRSTIPRVGACTAGSSARSKPTPTSTCSPT